MEMTLGQRIQQLRKEKGLSQEALGESLNVSRQAISKWESDAAIPELDKLIALSRQFGIPVGVLLGVEESSPNQEELSGRELAAVEEIVGRYLERSAEQERLPDKRRGVRLLLTGAVLLIAAGLTALTLTQAVRLHRLNDRLDTLQGSVAGMESTIQTQIGSIQDTLEQEDGILADWDCQVTGVDMMHKTLTLTLTATPKVYIEGMEMTFTAEALGEAPVTVQGAEQSGHSFTAVLSYPFHDLIRLTASSRAETGWQTQALDSLYGWSDDIALSLSLTASGDSGWDSEQEVWNVDWTLDGRFYRSGKSSNYYDAKSAELCAYRNGTLIQDIELVLLRGDAPTSFYKEYQTGIPVSAGDELSFELKYTDNFENACSFILQSVRIPAGEDGEPQIDLDIQDMDTHDKSRYRY